MYRIHVAHILPPVGSTQAAAQLSLGSDTLGCSRGRNMVEEHKLAAANSSGSDLRNISSIMLSNKPRSGTSSASHVSARHIAGEKTTVAGQQQSHDRHLPWPFLWQVLSDGIPQAVLLLHCQVGDVGPHPWLCCRAVSHHHHPPAIQCSHLLHDGSDTCTGADHHPRAGCAACWKCHRAWRFSSCRIVCCACK